MEHVCIVCGHVHDEAVEGKWDELADDFECPECVAVKKITQLYNGNR
jgi:rubredoxin